ncbi:NADPH-dependent FMN reductase [Stutzerimonas kirkiae]|uniref:NADPH-dependent FMN reductase n=1 Tax=Stutzerimonas kirkiae TaxID=2211392 RepID=A0A4V2KDI2_9GAMM|nr:NADPH-dependent FMN reductase [Stutzerimonas kirkiae]TBU99789.1 NADPH-dependent FMN reductase [Stutzerimonas kirkiae]TBV05279.1 NADPH-dependent FMN reductase [Stutzerimonas kirkiae]
MLVVSLAGSPSERSRGGVVLEKAREWLQGRGVEVVCYGIRDFVAEDLLHACFDSPQVLRLREHIAAADGLLVATPVYKASIAGALKVLLDLLPERALADKVVLPIATGGSEAHMLVVDYALKPVLAALKAQEVLQGVYAIDRQVSYAEPERPASLEPSLQRRLDDALAQFFEILARRPRALAPETLYERLVQSRWSI